MITKDNIEIGESGIKITQSLEGDDLKEFAVAHQARVDMNNKNIESWNQAIVDRQAEIENYTSLINAATLERDAQQEILDKVTPVLPVKDYTTPDSLSSSEEVI